MTSQSKRNALRKQNSGGERVSESFGFCGWDYNQVIVFKSAEKLREVLEANPLMEPIIGAGQDKDQDFPGVHIAGIKVDVHVREEILAEQLGEEALKEVCADIARLMRKHGLHRQPGTCRTLLFYMSDVIKGWNSV